VAPELDEPGLTRDIGVGRIVGQDAGPAGALQGVENLAPEHH